MTNTLQQDALTDAVSVDLVAQLRNGGRRIRSVIKTRRISVMLMPRGRRRDYVCAWEKLPPIRLWHFSRHPGGWHFYLFLPNLPFVGAWRLCINRHSSWGRQ